MKKLLLLLLMVVSTAVGSWAQTADETPLYTCLFGSDYNKGNSSYTESWTATNNNFTWNIVNFNNNNNNSQWKGQIKCGNKTAASIATITTSTAINEVIDRVTVKIDAITTSKVNSISLVTSKTENFDASNCIETKSVTAATGDQSVILDKPEAGLYYRLIFDCQKGSANGLVTLSAIKYYEKKEEVDKSQPATKIEFDQESGELATATIVHLTTDGLDKDGNMLPIYYTTDGTEANASSAKYDVEAGILVDRAMTINAYVSDGVKASASYTIAPQLPATPVVKYNNEVVVGDVNAYYGEEIVVTSAMANKLIVESTEEEAFDVEGNTYTITAEKNDVIYFIKGVNEDGEGETAGFTVYINKPEAPVVKFGETTVSEDGEFEVSKGTVVSVVPGKGSNEVVVKDENEEVVELVDGTFTLSENGEYMYTITSVSPVKGVDNNFIVVSFEVTTTQTKTATFDFTSESGAYGMKVYSGNNTEFEKNVKSVASNGVTAIFDGRYRIWKNTPNELRLAKETTTLNPGIITFVVPSNCLIQKITINGKVVKGLVCETSGATLNVDSDEKDNQQTSVTAVNGLDEITIKAGTAAVQQINTITIEYISYEADAINVPVVELDQNTTEYSNAKFNITADKGHHIWYFYKIVNPSAKMSVASAEEIQWDQKVEHYNHTVVPSTHISTLNPGQFARFGFAAYNPDTQAISPIVYKSVKPDGQLSGVEDVEVENGVEAEYFNLQGVRVAAPLAPGLYIERRGDKAVKVRIN